MAKINYWFLFAGKGYWIYTGGNEKKDYGYEKIDRVFIERNEYSKQKGNE